MKIGFACGWPFILERHERTGAFTSYSQEGFLIEKLLERGHEVVLLTRVPEYMQMQPSLLDEPHSPWAYDTFIYDPDGDVSNYDLDVLWTTKVGKQGNLPDYERVMQVLTNYQGPVVFHLHVAIGGLLPVFSAHPDLLVDKDWTILCRTDEQRTEDLFRYLMHHQVKKIDYTDDVFEQFTYRQWMPFTMRESLFAGDAYPVEAIDRRPVQMGYVGRITQNTKRADKLYEYYRDLDPPSMVWGPTTTWLGGGVQHGGAVWYQDVPKVLRTVQRSALVHAHALNGIDCWPDRMIENACAGVFQMFDFDMKIGQHSEQELTNYWVESQVDVAQWIKKTSDLDVLRHHVKIQQDLILPKSELSVVMNNLEATLHETTTRKVTR